jgi:hypothetical protein
MTAVQDDLRPATPADNPLPRAESGRTGRFTLDGSDELEDHLTRTCERVLAGVQELIPPRKLDGLLLGGGYGRGEGGVLNSAAGDRPYNDLEFYVFVRGPNPLNEYLYGAALHRLGKRLAPDAGVDVEFKIISSATLRRSPVSMFYYDLVAGHRRLWGGNMLAGCEHHGQAVNIPLVEATRLLMNRCSGLLFARQKLDQTELTVEDADFVGRNQAKAQLAFGDVILTAFGRYHWSCRQRYERLQHFNPTESLLWLDEARRQHAAGVAFKLHPQSAHPSSRGLLQSRHADLMRFALRIWLWLEARRLQCRFESPLEYALGPVNKCPETAAWRNYLVNAKVLGPKALFHPGSLRHPREKVLNALALMLWVVPPSDRQSHPLLKPWNNKFCDPVVSYHALWRKCN